MRCLGAVLVVATACAPEPTASWEAPVLPDPAGGAPGEPWSLVETIPDDLMPEDGLFRRDRVLDVQLTLTRDARTQLNRNDREYVVATMTVFGRPFEVGMRLKGSSTYQPLSGKPSIKIKLDHTVPGQEMFGYDGFNLHNNTADASFVGELMGHRLLTASDVPSLKVGYARVTIDGERKGLYTIVQRKDQNWIEEWFDDPEGSLYEGQGCDFGGWWGDNNGDCLQLDHEGSADTRDDLREMFQAMSQQGTAFWTAANTYMDNDRVMRALAAEVVIGHWDSYSGNLNNYHWYHEPTTGLWSMSPWSLDLSFGRPVGGDCSQIGVDRSHYASGRLANECRSNPTCDQRLRAEMETVLQVVENYPYNDIFDEIETLIEPHVTAEPTRNPSVGRWRQEVQCARTFLDNRRATLGL